MNQLPPNFANYRQPPRAHATPRRGAPIPGAVATPMPPQSMSNSQLTAQRNMSHQNDAAIRRSRRPTDKNIPDGVEDLIVGNGVHDYKKMREIERRLDATMVRKRLDLQDSVAKTAQRYKTMRIWITNTVEGQAWQTGDESNGTAMGTKGQGRYRLKIEGRLLEDDPESGDNDQNDDPDAMDQDSGPAASTDDKKKKAATPAKSRSRLSHFFKTITIDFEKGPGAKPEETKTITWNKPNLPPNAASLPPSADFDSLEFSRRANENVNITINLQRDDIPERFRVSPALADILDSEEETRAEIVAGIWDYIRAMGLQEDEERRTVLCDERLRQIFGRDQILFPQIPQGVDAHISKLDPTKLPYTIRVDKDFHADPTPTVYDVRVTVDEPLRDQMAGFLNRPESVNTLRQIQGLDEQLSLVIQTLQHSKARHSFFYELSKDPVQFLQRWKASQEHDLATILGDHARGPGDDPYGPEWRRGGEQGAYAITPRAIETARLLLSKP